VLERTVVAAVMALALVPAAARGQDWREMTSFRQRADVRQLDVHVRYGAGKLRIQPSSEGELYRVGLRYDSDVFDPVASFDNGRLEVGVDGRGRGINIRSKEAGELSLDLSPDIPLDLDLDFGAVEADLELGGLRVERIDVETGASDTEITFSEPNEVTCERLEISMGAAALRARGLANANCRVVRGEGGVGELTLEFSGDWRQDIQADLTMALGALKIVVPEDVGVRVDKDTFLTDFSGPRFSKRDGVYYSDNWERAARKLTIDLDGAFGSMEVDWIRPSTVTP
jgi:hypothetical protein